MPTNHCGRYWHLSTVKSKNLRWQMMPIFKHGSRWRLTIKLSFELGPWVLVIEHSSEFNNKDCFLIWFQNSSDNLRTAVNYIYQPRNQKPSVTNAAHFKAWKPLQVNTRTQFCSGAIHFWGFHINCMCGVCVWGGAFVQQNKLPSNETKNISQCSQKIKI